MYEIAVLGPTHEEGYSALLHSCPEAVFTHSLAYRDVLAEVLSCKHMYLTVLHDNEVVGALPLILKENSRYGNAVCSLAFFGSHGGFLLKADIGLNERDRIKRMLLEGLSDIVRRYNCIMSTIITSPLDQDREFYEANLHHAYEDYRQAPMVEFRANIENPENEIMYKIVDPDNRRTIKRPIKNGITIEYSNDAIPLFEMNRETITAKGGLIQPITYFDSVIRHMKKDDYWLMYAKKDSTIIAGLLLFPFKDMVNYSLPAYKRDYAIEQGTSFLIYEAMKRSIGSGYRYFNFGGTKESQKDLHRFKARWGTKDYQYKYYITKYCNIDHILNMREREILEEYKYFYVIPFSELRS